ncbi:ABC transporter ATP-binding protein [Telmatospirillum sp.]|uniref:ABC transporter ATP-binding protein n=1 Tax=Telmatospirillum sp. TaxID=2079197 RepID=UPI003867E6E1
MLKLEDVDVRMGAQQVLRGITLDVGEKAVVTVIGSNGVGKTTLMRTISGIYRCTAGSITFLDQPITNLKSHRIVRQGLVQAPEGRMIFGPMTVRENLVLGAISRPAAEVSRQLEHVLSLFPLLGDRLRQKAGSLSGGEQQMLCIGRALMAKPRLLLLDEPSLGLAPLMVQSIFDLIGEIRSQGTAILLVEQNARAALRISDYAYVMEGGRIVLEGPADELSADDRVQSAYLGGKAH